MQLKLGGVDYVQVNSPNGSILRPTGAEGGRLGPSIIGGGEGCPPLTGEGAYESPVVIKPSFYYSKKETLNRSVLWWRGRRPGLSSSQVSVKVKKKKNPNWQNRKKLKLQNNQSSVWFTHLDEDLQAVQSLAWTEKPDAHSAVSSSKPTCGRSKEILGKEKNNQKTSLFEAKSPGRKGRMELNQELNKDHGKRVYWLCLFKCISALTYSQTRHKSHSLVTQLRRLDLFLVQSSLCVTSVHLEEEKKKEIQQIYLFILYISFMLIIEVLWNLCQRPFLTQFEWVLFSCSFI